MIYGIAAGVCFVLLALIYLREIVILKRVTRYQWDAIRNLRIEIEKQAVKLNGVKSLAEHTAKEQASKQRKEAGKE